MSSSHPHSKDPSHTTSSKTGGTKDLAAEVIRNKLRAIYAKEPSARLEEQEVTHLHHAPSKHQKFMQDLHNSGKSLPEIQTAWHNYYIALPDTEKQGVWDEFYKESAKAKEAQQQAAATPAPKAKPRTTAQVKKQLLNSVAGNGKLTKKHHLQSIAFGLGIGAIAVMILLFGFFNERIIAPFITPSKAVSDTPLIVDNSTAVSGEPKVIIPKINVEIPVVYNVDNIEEATIQAALEHGVVHYPTTPNPGQVGNVSIFGHSSNNILNKGQYKFAFVLLNRLQEGDTFMLTKDGKRYTYRVYKKHVVKPTDISVLGPQEKPSTATLITCDPPGTSINRLVVVGEQISPDPAQNGASTAIQAPHEPTSVPGNSPSLWYRLTQWLSAN